MANTTDTTAALAPKALKGWAALMFATNVTLPKDLSRAQAVRLATLQVLRRG